MTIAYGVGWNYCKRNQLVTLLMATILALSLFSVTAQTASIPSLSGPTASVIVREAPASTAAEQVVEDVGGKVGRELGIIDPATAAVRLEPPSAVQTFPRATGTGTIEGARGSAYVVVDGREIAGEIDVFGNSWSGNSWSGNSWSGNSWSAGEWD